MGDLKEYVAEPFISYNNEKIWILVGLDIAKLSQAFAHQTEFSLISNLSCNPDDKTRQET